MVLIISEQNDFFTSRVMQWLDYYDVTKVVRVNENTEIGIEYISEKNITLNINGQPLNFDEISYYWYRRGNLNLLLDYFLDKLSNRQLKSQVKRFLQYEWQKLSEYLYYQLNKKPSLGNYGKSATNKLINLDIAQLCGLKVPKFVISNKHNVAKDFISRTDSITKPIGEVLPIYLKNGHYKMLTSGVSADKLLDDNPAFPSQYQQKILKAYEIRTFIVHDELYSMAIYSQCNNKTCIDYRNYDFTHMNRMVPYKLPISIQKQLISFMGEVGLDTGSIDLIKSIDGDYYFLEVNPAGNIEMVSDSCNYNIEKRIAEIIRDECEKKDC
ncbi:grasp-with-spasm system ATP-grasp peptide maturase [Carboxylicivirga sp. M1479]|uniref:grasp-with-spasm system ATP-grasp peptide maturase n=1 Tax=Carboxylicivirga sp. M1479 TaxID=2594476 RepID=UPI001177C28B|nr:grasp-with-spasm system ATP-grasp peptide maturase [Carboxylicivirga sp. M1479]TRX65898.1 grasp-with-spasm system ATP-grasp peptide maturase [Carboxylicivirga sp. M1479]